MTIIKSKTAIVVLVAVIIGQFAEAGTMPYANDFSSTGLPSTSGEGTWTVTSGLYDWTTMTDGAASASIPISDATSPDSFTVSSQFTLISAGNDIPGGTSAVGFGILGKKANFSAGNGQYLADFVVANGSAGEAASLGRLRILNQTTSAKGTATVTQAQGGGVTLGNSVITSIATNTIYTLELKGIYSGATLTLTLSLFDATGTAQIGPSATLTDASPLQGANFGYRNNFGSGSGEVQFRNFIIAPYAASTLKK